MSTQALSWVFDHSPITNLRDRAVLLVLANYAGADGTCYPSVATLAKKSAVSESSVHRAIRALIDAGAIIRHSNAGIRIQGRPDRVTNLYEVVYGVSDRHPVLPGDPPNGVSHRTERGVTADTQTKEEPKKELLRATEYPKDFERAWTLYPKKLGKRDGFKRWTTLIKRGVNPEDLITATEHFAQVMKTEAREVKFIMFADRFFGDGEHWKDYLEPPKVHDPAAEERAYWARQDEFQRQWNENHGLVAK